MDVERLIWGYIDGELTPEEDQLLRELIARDEQARQLYEAVLSLYIELRRDAETLAPTGASATPGRARSTGANASGAGCGSCTPTALVAAELVAALAAAVRRPARTGAACAL
jgi:anti-sigma factor RsiW